MSATLTPRDIKAHRSTGELEITWSDGAVSRYAFHDLRCACGCAGCVHEITGERILEVSQVPLDITVESMQLVGSYAVRIDWSDGHNTGLYTWSKLRELSGLGDGT